MTVELRPYQVNILEDLKRIYAAQTEARRRAFLQMPTGTGKTVTALSFTVDHLSGYKNKNAVWLAHQSNLVAQAKQSFVDNFKTTTNADGSVSCQGVTVHFQTWQGFRDRPEEFKKSFQLVLTDEVHCGGSDSNTDKVSFSKILAPGIIADHLYISATPWDLSSELFAGLGTEHLAEYSWVQAIQDGFISDVIFCKYDSALSLLVEDEETGESKELHGQDTEELVGEAKEEGVNIRYTSSQQELDRAKAICLFEAFFQEEAQNGTLPATLVFCRSVNVETDMLSAINLQDMFQKMAAKKLGRKSGKAISALCYGALKDRDPDAVLEAFKVQQPKVLFVMKMANEGFDYPGLEVAIDFALNAKNAKRTVQKIGRILRPCKATGKTAGRYYYADSIDQHLRVEGERKVLSPEFIEDIRNNTQKMLGREPTELELKSVTGNTGLNVALDFNAGLVKGGGPAMPHPVLGVSEIKHDPATEKLLKNLGAETKKGVVSKVGFIVKEAFNHGTEARRWNLHGCFTKAAGAHNVDANIQELLTLARNNQPRPSQKTSLGASLPNYLSPKSECYRPEFAKEIRMLRPDWFAVNMVNHKKVELLKLAKSGISRPSSKKHPLGGALNSYINLTHGSYDGEFHKTLQDIAPHWFVKSSDTNKQKIMDIAIGGGERPAQKRDKLGPLLCAYTNPAEGCYDEQFTNKLRSLRPDWFNTSMIKAKRIRHLSAMAERSKTEIIEYAKKNSEKPHYKENASMYGKLIRYMCISNECYDANFANTINELRPEWGFGKNSK